MLPLNPSSLPDDGRGASILPPSDHRNVLFTAWGVVTKMAIPAGAKFAAFGGDGDIWMAFGDANVAPAVPQANVIDGSAADFNPGLRPIPTGSTHVGVISAGASFATIAFYS